jgi:hypothetical protein
MFLLVSWLGGFLGSQEGMKNRGLSNMLWGSLLYILRGSSIFCHWATMRRIFGALYKAHKAKRDILIDVLSALGARLFVLGAHVGKEMASHQKISIPLRQKLRSRMISQGS